MAATYAAWKAKLDGALQRLTYMIANFQNSTIGQWGDGLRLQPQSAPAIPTTSVALDRTFSHAIGQQNGGSGKLRIGRVDISFNQIAGGVVLVYDRLNHSGGMDGTVATPQTTNIPTAALTRSTGGDGVWIALQVWANLGATPATVTASYTNQAGTAGRTTEAVAIGNNNSPAERLILLPLQPGDTGARSVESVTLSGTTGTAGNFGVVLLKPIFMLPATSAQTTWSFPFDVPFMEEIIDGACLAAAGYAGSGNMNQLQMNLHFVED